MSESFVHAIENIDVIIIHLSFSSPYQNCLASCSDYQTFMISFACELLADHITVGPNAMIGCIAILFITTAATTRTLNFTIAITPWATLRYN